MHVFSFLCLIVSASAIMVQKRSMKSKPENLVEFGKCLSEPQTYGILPTPSMTLMQQCSQPGSESDKQTCTEELCNGLEQPRMMKKKRSDGFLEQGIYAVPDVYPFFKGSDGAAECCWLEKRPYCFFFSFALDQLWANKKHDENSDTYYCESLYGNYQAKEGPRRRTYDPDPTKSKRKQCCDDGPSKKAVEQKPAMNLPAMPVSPDDTALLDPEPGPDAPITHNKIRSPKFARDEMQPLVAYDEIDQILTPDELLPDMKVK